MDDQAKLKLIKSLRDISVANTKAIDDKQEILKMDLDGSPWQQPPFAYQAKCLRWIRQEHSQLSSSQRRNWLG